MRLATITAAAKGDADKELAMLNNEVVKGSDDVELYIRLSSLYRIKREYALSWEALEKAEKLLAQVDEQFVSEITNEVSP
ncbi:MAG TPA: hypothetical protein VF622_20250 [Segetibacter sp.]